MLPSPLRSTRSTPWMRVSGMAPRSRLTPVPSRRSVSAAGAAEHAPAAGAEALEKRGVEQGEDVVVGAAVQNVEAAVAEQRVVALGAEDHVIAGRADQRVVARGRRAGSRRW